MPAIIGSLLQDHHNMERLLQILEQQVAALDRAGRPDFEILIGMPAIPRLSGKAPSSQGQSRRNTTLVRLTGRVPNETERQAAECDAWMVFGVDAAVNEIRARP